MDFFKILAKFMGEEKPQYPYGPPPPYAMPPPQQPVAAAPAAGNSVKSFFPISNDRLINNFRV